VLVGASKCQERGDYDGTGPGLVGDGASTLYVLTNLTPMYNLSPAINCRLTGVGRALRTDEHGNNPLLGSLKTISN